MGVSTRKQHPEVIRFEIRLDDDEMSRPSDVASLLARIARAFDGPDWPVFDKLYDGRGKVVGLIRIQYRLLSSPPEGELTTQAVMSENMVKDKKLG